MINVTFLSIPSKVLKKLNHIKIKWKNKKEVVVSKANNTVKMSVIDSGKEIKKKKKSHIYLILA